MYENRGVHRCVVASLPAFKNNLGKNSEKENEVSKNKDN